MAYILALDALMGTIGIITVYLYLRSRGSRIPLPPGPRKLPIIGNLLDLPAKYPAQEFDKLCKKCNSDIIHLSAFGNNIIVINSYDTAKELMERRSSIYSSRPRSIMFNELSGYSYLFVAMPDNALWKTYRRLFSRYFHPRKTAINHPREIEHVHRVLGKLLDSPENFMAHIRHMVGALSISEVYGLEVNSEKDPFINIAEEVLDLITQMATPGAFLVETFPFLKFIPEWFPGAHFHQFAKRARRMSTFVLDEIYNASVASMKDRNITSSFISKGLLDIQNSTTLDHSQHIQSLKEVGIMTYLGATDTTNAALQVFMLAMMLYPDVQRTAQQELDKVLGDRLPSHGDIPSIPYITAILLEVLRWETPIPTGLGHTCTENDVFRGYYIPKGSVVIALQREMLHSERDYPDPHMFKPERFLKKGKICDDVRSPEDICFGFGRRKCPGRHLAKSSLWIAIASILFTFDIEKPVDKNGKTFESTYSFGGSGVTHVEPFECRIKPRSDKAVSLISSVMK